MSRTLRTLLCILALPLAMAASACGDGDETSTGAACDSADACYHDTDVDNLAGDPVCLAERVPGGYCTHTCQSDADCCTAEGECYEDVDYVCSPLENSTTKYCFVSCDGADDSYCHEFAGDAFGCRSTGGGSQNRKVCLP